MKFWTQSANCQAPQTDPCSLPTEPGLHETMKNLPEPMTLRERRRLTPTGIAVARAALADPAQ
jgi:hypothetical protein